MQKLATHQIKFETHNYSGFDSIGDNIIFHHDLNQLNIRHLCSVFHTLITKQGYTSLVLDFSKTTRVWHTRMLALLSQVRLYAAKGTKFKLALPHDESTQRLFLNAGWAHYIDDSYNLKTPPKGAHLPTLKFCDNDEATDAIDKIMEITLRSLALPRQNLAAFEWALAELTDNVLSHSQSNLGGFIHVEITPKNKIASLCFVDAGSGIPRTLRDAIPEYDSDVIALENSIKEGVTSNKNTNRGNGLYGCYQMAVLSEGFFKIESGYAKLNYSKAQGLVLDNPPTPFNGTYLECKICLGSDLLTKALTFNDMPYQITFDYIDKKEIFLPSVVTKVIVKDESKSFRLRADGLALRNKITNMANYTDEKIYLDFSDITVVSSSFADEAFGKLINIFGFVGTTQKFEFINLNPTLRQLIDRAIIQRANG